MVRSLTRTAALIGRARREYGGLAEGQGRRPLAADRPVAGGGRRRRPPVPGDGIIVGSIIALGALGITLIYGILKFAHFAHGDMMMFGAYIAFAALVGGGSIGPLSFGWGMIFAILVSMASLGAGSVAIDRVVYRPLRQRGSGTVVSWPSPRWGWPSSCGRSCCCGGAPISGSMCPASIRRREFPFDIMLKPDQIFIVRHRLVC